MTKTQPGWFLEASVKGAKASDGRLQNRRLVCDEGNETRGIADEADVLPSINGVKNGKAECRKKPPSVIVCNLIPLREMENREMKRHGEEFRESRPQLFRPLDSGFRRRDVPESFDETRSEINNDDESERLPCKNSMNLSRSVIWVFSWSTSFSFTFPG